MYRRALPIGCLLFSLLATVGNAQSPYFQNYFLLRKNEALQVQTLFQDRRGYLWVGTDKGLFQFDGIAARQFTTRDSLAENSVSAVAEDSLGRIWIGHSSGKISIRNQRGFTLFDPPEGSAAGEVSDILFDRHGRLWFSTLNDGLYYWMNDRLYRLDQEDGMPDIFIYDLELDKDGNVIAGTDGGLAICRLVDRKASIETVNYSNGLPDNIIKKMAAATDGSLWLATEDAGVVQFDMLTKKVSTITPNWNGGAIQDMIAFDNQVWVVTAPGDLMVYENGSRVARYKAPVSSVSSLLRDIEGNIWIGSKTGLSRTLGNAVEYIDTFDPFANTNVAAVAVDAQRTIWYSTAEGLFKRTLNQVVEHVKLPAAYARSSVISLYADPHGFVWAGTYGEGVLRIDVNTGAMVSLRHELVNGSVLQISGDNRFVWLSTLGGGTRIEMTGTKKEIKNFGTREGLSSDYVYQVFTDSRNRVWFATDRAGIDCLDGSNMRHIKEPFTSKAVYAIIEDADHRIWANVQGDGLVLVEGEPLTGLPKNWKEVIGNPLSVSTDGDGNLVLMNDRGIVFLDVKSKTIRVLADEVGFRERIANLNAVARTSDGTLWFGTEEGMVVYNGVNKRAASYPLTRITGLRAFDEEIEIDKDVTLRYNQNNLTFQIRGFWYQNPQGVSFEYKLENYDREWISTGDRFVVYSSVPPGNYTFQVRASNQLNLVNTEVASLPIQINPPFWRTTLFYIAAALATLLTGYGYIRMRESRLLREKVVLEHRVQERTMEIQKKNEEIQAQSEEIKSINDNLERMVHVRTAELEKKNKALEEYAFINAHNLRAPVASILGLINLLSKVELDDKGKEVVKHMEQSADRLDSVVKSITEAIERGETPLPFRNVKDDEVD